MDNNDKHLQQEQQGSRAGGGDKCGTSKTLSQLQSSTCVEERKMSAHSSVKRRREEKADFPVTFIPSDLVADARNSNNAACRSSKRTPHDTFDLRHAEHNEDSSLPTDHSTARTPRKVPSTVSDENAMRSASDRRLHSVRLKVELAEAILRNAGTNARIPLPPEERRRNMVQLEVAKLIVFVGRHFNVYEELQQGLGRALDVADNPTYHRRGFCSEIPFLTTELPPDLSLEELKRTASEMEKRLEKEKAEKGDAWNTSSFSVDRVTSNLSDLLWIIESLELEVSNTREVDIDERQHSSRAGIVAAVNPLGTQKQEPFSHRTSTRIIPDNAGPRGRLSKTGIFLTDDAAAAAAAAAAQWSSLSIDPSLVRGEAKEKKEHEGGLCEMVRPQPTEEDEDAEEEEEKLIGFSVDDESLDSLAKEGANLKLLQFMHDAIVPEDESQNYEEDELASKDASGLDVFNRTRSSTHGRTIGSMALVSLGATTRSQAQENTLPSLKGTTNSTFAPFMDLNAGSSHQSTGSGRNSTLSQQQSSSTTHSMSASVDAETTPIASWMPPAYPTVELHPLREELIDILRELYNNFDYKYHFQQCRLKGRTVTNKSNEEYAAEMELRLANQKLEKLSLAARLQGKDGDGLLNWEGGRTAGSVRSAFGSTHKVSTVNYEEDEDITPVAEDETSPTAPSPGDDRASADASNTRNQMILLSVELGDGLLFVLKGGKRRQSSVAAAAARSNRRSGKKQKKRTTTTAALRSATSGDENGTTNDDSNAQGGTVSEDDKKKTNGSSGALNFDEYILYAINQSDKQLNAVVDLDMSKLQNLRLIEISDHVVRSNSIAVNLASYSSTAVLKLRPSKKGRRVMFDGALSFREGTVTFEKKMSKSEKKKVKKRKSLRSSSEMFSQEVELEESPSLSGFLNTRGTLVDTDACVNYDVPGKRAHITEMELVRAASPREAVMVPSKSRKVHEHKRGGSSRDKNFGRLQPLGLLPPGRLPGQLEEIDMLDEEVEVDAEDWRSGTLCANDDEEGKRWKTKSNWAQHGNAKDASFFKNRPKSGGRVAVAESGAVGDGYALCEENGDVVMGMLPVDQWGVPISDKDAEAFENNCVALSVLQASGWQGSASQPQGVCGEDGGLAATGASRAGSSSGRKQETLVDAILTDSQSSVSQQYPSARFGSHASAEQMVAAVLQYIADEEQLNTFDELQGVDNLSASVAASCRRQLSSRMQQLRDGSSISSMNQMASGMRPPSSSVGLQRSTEMRHQQSSEEEGKVPLSMQATMGAHLHPHMGAGDSLSQNILCEECAGGHHFDGVDYDKAHSGIGDDDDAARIQSQHAFQLGQLSSKDPAIGSEGNTGTAALQGKPRDFVEFMLKDIVSIDRTQQEPSSLLHLLAQHEIPDDVPFSHEGAESPLLQPVFVNSRPNGRVTFFVPDTIDDKDMAFGDDASTMVKGMLERRENAGMVAEGIRATMHRCARQAMLHGNQLQGAQAASTPFMGGITRNGKTVGKKPLKSPHYSNFPPLPVLYAPEAMPEMDDIGAAEEEALDLFMRDPARYDCVVDDIVERAFQRVNEEDNDERMRREAAARMEATIAGEEGREKGRKGFQMSSPIHRHLREKTQADVATTPSSAQRGSVSIGSEGNYNVDMNGARAGRSAASLSSEGKRDLNGLEVDLSKELEHFLNEERRSKKLVAYILMELRRMWRRREIEANIILRAAVERFIQRSVLFTWRLERRRVLNLQKLIHILDRKTGRVAGWLPFYAKDNVLQDRFVWEPAPPYLSRPLRVVHQAMCLARQQRLFPLRVVRNQARRKVATRHLLYGYERRMLDRFTTTALRLQHERRTRLPRISFESSEPALAMGQENGRGVTKLRAGKR